MRTATATLLLAACLACLAASSVAALDTSSGSSAATTIPVLNFAQFLDGDKVQRYDFARQLLAALVGPGFFYLENHGVDNDLVWQVFNASDGFFGLDAETKGEFRNDGSPQGYRGDGEEILYGTQADFKESLTLSQNQIKAIEDAGHIDDSFRKLWHQLVQAELDLMKAYGLALNQDEDFFAKHVVAVPSEQTMSALRVVNYPPKPTDVERYKCAPHTDFGLATLLFQNGISGLELWHQQTHQWERVDPIDGAMVVNTGNLMQRWSNDLFYSSLHRVMPDAAETETRKSLVFFGTANAGSVCDPHQLDMKYDPIDAGQFYVDLVNEAYSGDAVQLFYGWAKDAMDLADRERIEEAKAKPSVAKAYDGERVGHGSRVEL